MARRKRRFENTTSAAIPYLRTRFPDCLSGKCLLVLTDSRLRLFCFRWQCLATAAGVNLCRFYRDCRANLEFGVWRFKRHQHHFKIGQLGQLQCPYHQCCRYGRSG